MFVSVTLASLKRLTEIRLFQSLNHVEGNLKPRSVIKSFSYTYLVSSTALEKPLTCEKTWFDNLMLDKSMKKRKLNVILLLFMYLHRGFQKINF